MKNILLVCAAGMSTSMLVQKMQLSAEKQGIDARIWAVGETDAKLAHKEADILLLGPQVRFLEQKMIKLVDGTIPVRVMDMQAYGMMNGEKVLGDALKTLEENE